jgi:hypothetical protein
MNEFNENDIGTLLRLKRHEQPPADYFDNFLHEFHRRQRAELLRQPLWRIALQRTQDFMLQLNVPTLTSYPAAAMAVVVCAAVLSLKVYQTPESGSARATVATVAVQQNTAPVAVAVAAPSTVDESWSLSSRDFGSTPFRSVSDGARTHRPAASPRYVLDSTPVSYEPSLRF